MMYFPEVPAFVCIVTCLVASCLIYAGGIGILAAIICVDWRLHVSAAILLLSPLLLLPAVDLFWMLGLQALLVALQVHIANRYFLVRETASPRSDQYDEGKRFSIATGLFVTALTAGTIMVLRATPELNLLAWYSYALIAVTASWFTLIAWLVVNVLWRWWVKWPLAVGMTYLLAVPLAWTDHLLPSLTSLFWGWPPEIGPMGFVISDGTPTITWFAVATAVLLFMSAMLYLGRGAQAARSSRRILIASLTSPLLVLLGWTCLEIFPPRRDPPVKEAAHLACERALELSKRIGNSDFASAQAPYGGWEAMPAQQLDTALATIKAEIDELMVVLRGPVALTPASHFDDINQLAPIRESTRALLASGWSQSSAGQADNAMEAYLSAVRMGIKTRRGGLMVDELIGRAVTSSCTDFLYRARHQVSSETRTKVCVELTQLIDQLEPVALILERDRIWTKSQGWFFALQLLIGDLAQIDDTSWYLDNSRTIRQAELAEMRLLILEFALSSYAIDNDGFPETLDALVPRYLSALPADPFALPGQGFKYLLSDADYQLYSIGQNGVDDGGMPYPSDPASGVVDRSIGDMTLKVVSGN